MGTRSFINAAFLTEHAFKPVLNGRSAVEAVLDYAAALPEAGEVIILAGRDFESRAVEHGVPGLDRCSMITRDSWSFQDVVKEMLARTDSAEHFFYMYGDCPLLSSGLAEDLFRTHTAYYADYTFADGYPYGLTPEIIRTEMLQAVQRLAGDTPVPLERDSMFTVIQRDINAFDIETELSPEDMRMLRVSLSCDSRRNYLQAQNIIRAASASNVSHPSAEEVMNSIREHPENLRTLPAFINVQISGGCPQACSYCPYPSVREDLLETEEEMSLELFQKIAEETARFCGDAVVGIGYLGEPACSSRVGEIAETVLGCPELSLLIETSGIGWKQEAVETIAAAARSMPRGIERTTWIISLDAWSPDVYQELRGGGYSEAAAFVQGLREIFPDTVYVQAVRMKNNEADLEDFYRNWKKDLDRVIIQKYDDFCGILPQRMVTDLSPVKRFPCWHIKRDLAVLIDGTVPQCKEDVNRSRILGSLAKDSIETVWERAEDIYREHLRETYSPMCKRCDEYYTYNF